MLLIKKERERDSEGEKLYPRQTLLKTLFSETFPERLESKDREEDQASAAMLSRLRRQGSWSHSVWSSMLSQYFEPR